MSDEQLLKEYCKEISPASASCCSLTVAELIERHRRLRQKSIEWNDTYGKAAIKGYKAGYEFGVQDAGKNVIKLQDLRKMTLEEIANLIGTDDY
jgi:hypothetical protein